MSTCVTRRPCHHPFEILDDIASAKFFGDWVFGEWEDCDTRDPFDEWSRIAN
jgi:hypothetical protein